MAKDKYAERKAADDEAAEKNDVENQKEAERKAAEAQGRSEQEHAQQTHGKSSQERKPTAEDKLAYDKQAQGIDKVDPVTGERKKIDPANKGDLSPADVRQGNPAGKPGAPADTPQGTTETQGPDESQFRHEDYPIVSADPHFDPKLGMKPTDLERAETNEVKAFGEGVETATEKARVKRERREEVASRGHDAGADAPQSPVGHDELVDSVRVPAEHSEITPLREHAKFAGRMGIFSTENPAQMPHDVIMEAYHGSYDDFSRLEQNHPRRMTTFLNHSGAPANARWLLMVDAGGRYRSERADTPQEAQEKIQGHVIREGLVIHRLSI
jgi:hypothetical protein